MLTFNSYANTPKCYSDPGRRSSAWYARISEWYSIPKLILCGWPTFLSYLIMPPCQQDKTRGFHWPLGTLGYSIFYQYRDMDVKVLGSYDYDFFQGFISRYIIFQGVNLHSYLFQGGRLKFLFIGIIFSQGLNCLRFNSRVFMNQQSFFPGHIDFLKIWSSKSWIKNGPLARNGLDIK